MVEKKREEMGEVFKNAVRRVLLQAIDFLWVEHLEAMEYLRSSVNLRAYGQRDPLVEYKKEGLRLFQTMEETYAAHVRSLIPNLLSPTQNGAMSGEQRSFSRAASSITAQHAVQQKKEYGRNDKVVVTNGTETKELKFKKAEPLLTQGWRIIS